MRKLLLLLPLLIFSPPAHAQEINLDCLLYKFYMREGEPSGVHESLLGKRHKANIFWQGDTIIVKWSEKHLQRHVDINRITGEATDKTLAEWHTFSCNKIKSAPRKF